MGTAVPRMRTASARNKRKHSDEHGSKRNTRPFLVAEVCAGISGGMVGAVRAGEKWPHQDVEPLYAADTCDKNGQVSRAVFGCQILTGDATSDVIRRRITKLPTPKLIIFTPSCQGNSLLNLYASEKANRSPTSGDKRLWLGPRLFETVLLKRPRYVIVEQLANWRGTEPLPSRR